MKNKNESRISVCCARHCSLIVLIMLWAGSSTNGPRLLCLLLAFVTCFSSCSSGRILDIAFMTSKSHKITYEPLIQALALRGHQITRITPYTSDVPIPNIREIKTIDVDEILRSLPDIFQMAERGQDFDPATISGVVQRICEQTFNLPQMKEFIASVNTKQETFDLVLVEAFTNECVAGIVHQLNTSIIIVSPLSAPPLITSLLGNPSPPSFVPNLYTGFSDDMNFFERVVNFLVEMVTRVVWKIYFYDAMESIYREKLGDLNLPGVQDVFSKASLILSNGHFSLIKPRSLLPNVVEVGGMHCSPSKPLPKELDDFVSSSEAHGFIYFSMGSALNATQMPEKYRRIFVNTFAKLKHKVLWKWETEYMEDLPENVKLSKWVPQQDVLGHPNIKMFITHGGFGGVTEAVYHGVPLLGIPMFGDQSANMKKVERDGYGLGLDFGTLSEGGLADAINKILTTPKYSDMVKHLSNLLRDQLDKPLDRAIFWTEYVIRHKGAKHLRSAAQDLTFIQYHSIDVVAVLTPILLCIIVIVALTLNCICRRLFGAKTETNSCADVKKKCN